MIELHLLNGIEKDLENDAFPYPITNGGIPKGDETPYLVVTCLPNASIHPFQVGDLYDIHVQFDLYTMKENSSAFAMNIMDQVKNLFERKSHTYTNITSCESWSYLKAPTRLVMDHWNKTSIIFRFKGAE